MTIVSSVVGPFTGLFHENPNLVAFFAVLVVLLAGALFVGWKLALPTEPAREEFDARAATDEELERLFHICAATDGDALMEWYLSFHMEMPEKKFLVRGGFRDEVGGDLVPKDATTEAVLAEK